MAIDPLTASALVGAAESVPKMAMGAWQLYQANKFRKEYERPTYETPQQVKDVTKLAKREAARTKLPGEDILRQRTRAATASGVSALKEAADSPVDITSNIAGMVRGEQRAMTDLELASEELRQRNLTRMMTAMSEEAVYEDRKFELNEYQPYVRAMQAAAQLSAAGITNITGGIDSGISSGISTYGKMTDLQTKQSEKTYWDQMKMMYGGGGQAMPMGSAQNSNFNIRYS